MDLSQPTRQRLPSLSSLFGPLSSVRPLHSPLSDRPATYAASSPLDRPLVSPAYSDRSHTTSYFPSTFSPPSAQPRTTPSARYDGDRQNAPHLFLPSFPESGSHRFREPEQGRHDVASSSGLGGRWAMHQDAGRHEYTLGSRDNPASLRSPHDRFSFQFPGPKTEERSFREQPHYQHHDHQQPPHLPVQSLTQSSSTATSVSEGVPSKDGLGPKIWTGTHFLPRFVRAAEIPGEGMCYFYDDGSHCKTVIDGEAVNAHWGVTKAGKPRKRLAIACITCREKKIKCDPDYPRCVQCEKFGRICKFKNA